MALPDIIEFIATTSKVRQEAFDRVKSKSIIIVAT